MIGLGYSHLQGMVLVGVPAKSNPDNKGFELSNNNIINPYRIMKDFHTICWLNKIGLHE